MTDRDTFAAAALTGLIANGDYSVESTPLLAYRMADAMLRERDKTNHDAAPAARAPADRYVRRAAADVGGDRTDKAAPQPCEGTGDTPAPHATQPQGSVPGEGSVPDSGKWNEPVAWVAWFDDEDKPDADFLFSTKERADEWCCKRGADPVPLYRHPQPTLTDEEREAVEAAIIGGCEMADTLRKLLERMK